MQTRLYCEPAGSLIECYLQEGNKKYIVKRALNLAEAEAYAQSKGYLMMFWNPEPMKQVAKEIMAKHERPKHKRSRA